jgi:hypothetical protein
MMKERASLRERLRDSSKNLAETLKSWISLCPTSSDEKTKQGEVSSQRKQSKRKVAKVERANSWIKILEQRNMEGWSRLQMDINWTWI